MCVKWLRPEMKVSFRTAGAELKVNIKLDETLIIPEEK